MVDLVKITPPRVNFLDKNGKISREWYRFLLSQFTNLSELKISIEIIDPRLDALDAEVDVITGDIVELTDRIDNTDAWVAEINAKIPKIRVIQVTDTSDLRVMIGRLITSQRKMSDKIKELEALCLSNQVR